MGQECQKLSTSSILNPVLNKIGVTSSTAASSQNGEDAQSGDKDLKGAASLFGAGQAREFLLPFATSFTTRGDSAAWQWIEEESAVKDSLQLITLWDWIEELLGKLSYREVQILMKAFRISVDWERNQNGPLLYQRRRLLDVAPRETAEKSAAPGDSPLRARRQAEMARDASDEERDDEDALSPSLSPSLHATTPIGHIWKRLSLTERSLSAAFPSLSHGCLADLWLDLCDKVLFPALERRLLRETARVDHIKSDKEKDAERVKIRAKKEQLRALGLGVVARDPLLRLFFVVDVLHEGTRVETSSAGRRIVASVLGALGADKEEKGREAVFRDYAVLFAGVLHGDKTALVSLLLLAVSAQKVSVPPSVSLASELPLQRTLLSEESVVALCVCVVLLVLHPVHGERHRARCTAHEPPAAPALCDELRAVLRRAQDFLFASLDDESERAARKEREAARDARRSPGKDKTKSSAKTKDSAFTDSSLNGQEQTQHSSSSVASDRDAQSLTAQLLRSASLLSLQQVLEALDDDALVAQPSLTSPFAFLVDLLGLVSFEALQFMFRVVLHDVVPNHFEMISKVMDIYELSPELQRLNEHISLFHRYNATLSASVAATPAKRKKEKKNGERDTNADGADAVRLDFSEQRDAQRRLLSAEHDVFLLDAQWFGAWCRAMSLSATHGCSSAAFAARHGAAPPALPLSSSPAEWMASRTLACVVQGVHPVPFLDEPRDCDVSKYELSLRDPFAEELFADLDALAEEGVQGAPVPSLDNAALLRAASRFPGALELLPSGSLRAEDPEQSERDTKGEARRFVALPWAAGRALYEHYDPRSDSVPATVFRRALRFFSNVLDVAQYRERRDRERQSAASVAHGGEFDLAAQREGERESETEREPHTDKAVEAFVENFPLSAHGLFADISLGNASPSPSPSQSPSLTVQSEREGEKARRLSWALPVYWATRRGLCALRPADTLLARLHAVRAGPARRERDRERDKDKERDSVRVCGEWHVLEFLLHSPALSAARDRETSRHTESERESDHCALSVEQLLVSLSLSGAAPVEGGLRAQHQAALRVKEKHRLWALLPLTEKAVRRAERVLPFTAEHAWVLLSPDTAVLSLFSPSLSVSPSPSLSRSVAQGFMIEARGPRGAWPCDRVSLSTLGRALTTRREGEGEREDEVLRVGLRVDALADDLFFAAMEVSHIERRTETETKGEGEREIVTLTLRDPLLSSLGVAAPLSLSLDSPRLLLAGTVTGAVRDSEGETEGEADIETEGEGEGPRLLESVVATQRDAELVFSLLNGSTPYEVRDARDNTLLFRVAQREGEREKGTEGNGEGDSLSLSPSQNREPREDEREKKEKECGSGSGEGEKEKDSERENSNREGERAREAERRLELIFLGDGGARGLRRALRARGIVLSISLSVPSPSLSLFSSHDDELSLSLSPAKHKNDNTGMEQVKEMEREKAQRRFVSLSRRGARLGVVGLANLGNTCFLAAALQCLLRAPLFLPFLLTLQHKRQVNAASRLGSQGRLVEELARLAQCVFNCFETAPSAAPSTAPAASPTQRKTLSAGDAKTAATATSANDSSATGRKARVSFAGAAPLPLSLSLSGAQFATLSPTALLRTLQSVKAQFSGADQQDSQELLSELLDTLHEDLKSDARIVRERLGLRDAQPAERDTEREKEKERNPQRAGDAAWRAYLSRDASVVSHTLQGQLCTQLVCGRCGQCSQRFEPFTTLSLPIPLRDNEKRKSPAPGESGASGGGSSGISGGLVRANTVYPIVVRVHRRVPRVYPLLQVKPLVDRVASLLREENEREREKNGGRESERERQRHSEREEEVLGGWVALWDEVLGETERRSAVFSTALSLPPSATIEDLKRAALAQYFAADLDPQRRERDSERESDNESQSEDSKDNKDNKVSKHRNGVSPRATIASPSFQGDADKLAVENVENGENGEEDESCQATDRERETERKTETVSKKILSAETQREIDEFVNNSSVLFVGEQENHRIKKILDNKETLHCVLEDALSSPDEYEEESDFEAALSLRRLKGVELLVVENNKNLPLVASLSARKLNQLVEVSAAQSESMRDGLRWFFSLSLDELRAHIDSDGVFDADLLRKFVFAASRRFLDELEHAATSAPAATPLFLYGLLPSQGRLLADIDNIDRDDDPAELAESAMAVPISLSPARLKKTKSSSAARRRWPKSVAEFRVFDRVDAQDHKGQWYAGTVLQVAQVEVPSKGHAHANSSKQRDSQPPSTVDKEREKDKKASPSSLARLVKRGSKSAVAADDKAIELRETSGESVTLLRVHFDGYSALWDEWYDQSDLPRIAPVYSKSQRKLKIFDFQIVQRRLSYYARDGAQDESAPAPSGVDACAVGKIELLDQPWLVQLESYRSVEHGYQHVLEQALRFLPPEERRRILTHNVSWKDPVKDIENLLSRLPFKIRLLSSQNMHALPLSEAVVQASVQQQAAAASTPLANSQLAVKLRVSPYDSHYKTQLERTQQLQFRHRVWEGSLFPRFQGARPLANLFHAKLVVAIDWEVLALPSLQHWRAVRESALWAARREDDESENENHAVDEEIRVDFASASSRDEFAASAEREVDADRVEGEFVLPLVWLAPCAAALATPFRATRPCRLLVEDASIAENERRFQDKLREVRSASLAVAASSSEIKSTASRSTRVPRDNRPGLTVEHVLREFLASEEISDYYCETCRGSQRGTMYTSIHTLPDVLILHLKRLVMSSAGGAKIRTLVKFPIDGLQMHSFTTQYFHGEKEKERERESASGGARGEDDVASAVTGCTAGAEMLFSRADDFCYDLFGVVNHLGGISGGHYTAYACCEDISYDTAPGKSLDKDFSHTSWRDVHPLLREHLTQVGVGRGGGAEGEGGVFGHRETSPSTSRWYKFDDEFVHDLHYCSPSRVTPSNADVAQKSNGVAEHVIVSESAYLLFYQKRNISKDNLIRYL